MLGISGKDCGGATRVAPVGLVLGDGSRDSGWRAFDLGVEIARLTHGHAFGYLAAGFFAELIAQVVAGKFLSVAIDAARTPLEKQRDTDGVLLAVDRAVRRAEEDEPPTPERIDSMGSRAEDALGNALYCALVARDFEHGVRLAVNHSGNSCATGALTGNLLGAMWGVDAIPSRWRDGLELRETIETVAADVAALRGGTFDVRHEETRYPGW